MAVIDRDHIAFGHALPLRQVLRGSVVQRIVPLHRAVGRIGRLADRIEREGAERGAIAGRCRKRCGMAVAEIDIVEADRADGIQRIRRIRRRRCVLHHGPALDTRTDGRRVFGAVNGHRHRLGDRAAMAVIDRDHVAFGHTLPLRQILRGSVVQRIVPLHRAVGRIGRLADRIEREGAERGAIAGRCRKRCGMAVAEIDIVEADRADGIQRIRRIRRRRCVLHHGPALDTRGDRRPVVGAGDLDGQARRAGAAVIVGIGIAEDVRHLLAFGQRLDVRLRIVQRVGVAAVRVQVQRAVSAGYIVGNIAGRAVNGRDSMGILNVDVGIVRENVATHRVRRGIFLDRIGVGNRYRPIVCAGDLDGCSCPAEGTVSQPDGVCKGVD